MYQQWKMAFTLVSEPRGESDYSERVEKQQTKSKKLITKDAQLRKRGKFSCVSRRHADRKSFQSLVQDPLPTGLVSDIIIRMRSTLLCLKSVSTPSSVSLTPFDGSPCSLFLFIVSSDWRLVMKNTNLHTHRPSKMQAFAIVNEWILKEILKYNFPPQILVEKGLI